MLTEIEAALCRGEIVIATWDGGLMLKVEAMERWCMQCGMPSTDPRFKPIIAGLCELCREKNEKINMLTKELQVAIITEDYEAAAKIRDRLREVENK